MSTPFQFSLRRLLAVVALCGLGLADIRWFSEVQHYHGTSVWPNILGIFSLLTMGPSFGAAIGLLIRQPVRGAVYGGILFIFIGLLLPAINSGSGPIKPSPMHNMHGIGQAMSIFESTNGRLPAQANFDSNGRPLLSWRVHILPYIDQQALYNQFHLDEPWDSPHNQALIGKMPAIYASPPADGSDRCTVFLVSTGKGTAFEGPIGMKLSDIKDGLENTILLVEADANRKVIWTKPDDLEVNFGRPLSGLGHAHAEGFNVVFANGHIQFVAGEVDSKVLKALFTPNGGEAVRAEDLDADRK